MPMRLVPDMEYAILRCLQVPRSPCLVRVMELVVHTRVDPVVGVAMCTTMWCAETWQFRREMTHIPSRAVLQVLLLQMISLIMNLLRPVELLECTGDREQTCCHHFCAPSDVSRLVRQS